MSYVFVAFTILLAALLVIVIDSVLRYQFRVKNEMVNVMTQLCIELEADPNLLATLTERGKTLNDEQMLYKINFWLKTHDNHFAVH